MVSMRLSVTFQTTSRELLLITRVLHCEGYAYERFPDEIMEALLLEPFFTRRMKLLCRFDGFMLYGILGLDFAPPLNCSIQN